MVMPTVISTFAGCGGSSLGYKMAGFKELLAIDFEKNAVDTFHLNFPEVPVWQRDITQVTVNEILEFCNIKPGELDIFDGSPPCQGFSTAGKHRVNDTRNSLFKDYIRLIEGLQPKVFIMENVSGMIKAPMKGIFIEIMETMKSLNYNVKCKLMNAKYYEVPQSRERLIFIGVRKDLNKEPVYPEPSNKIITLAEAIGDLVDMEPDRKIAEWLVSAYPELNGKNHAQIFKKYKGTAAGSFSTILLNKHKPSQTLCKNEISVSGLLHYGKPRYLTALELLRICSFPDNFIYTDRKSLCNRLGNAVMPKMMYHIAKTIKERILI